MPSVNFRPMLACSESAHNFFDKLMLPLLASAKLDGIRATVRDGVVYARSNKPIPNKYVQSLFANYEYVDGELIVGESTAHDVYRQTTSHVMSHDKEDFPVRLFAFDHVKNLNDPYNLRLANLEHCLSGEHVVLHNQKYIETMNQLIEFEKLCLECGYEGVILRQTHSPYKCGRSTAKEQYLLKLKRFSDQEYKIVGFEERLANHNKAVINELGRTKRSSHKEGKVGRCDLGALILQMDNGDTFNCGTGFDDDMRVEIWNNKNKYLGEFAKIKSFLIGVKDKPRHPVFLGIRSRIDM